MSKKINVDCGKSGIIEALPGFLKGKFSDAVMDLSPNPASEILKYARSKHGGVDEAFIRLDQGESDRPTDKKICDAAKKALDDGHTFYGLESGRPKLRQALSTYHNRVFDQRTYPGQVHLTMSGVAAVKTSLLSVLNEGDDLVVVTPIWKNLLNAAELRRANIIQVPLDYDDEKCTWSLDMGKLSEAVTPRTRAIFVNSPSNPTGWMATQEEQKNILDLAQKNGAWTIADEVYTRLVLDGERAPSFLDIAKEEDLLLVVKSFSKSYAMTGWRMGWVVAPRAAEGMLEEVIRYENLCPQDFTQFGAIEALKSEHVIQEQLERWRKNRDLVVERFERMDNVSMAYPESTFYGFFKVQGENDCVALAKRLVDEAGVVLAPGRPFGKGGEGFLRLCFAKSEETIIDALDRLENAPSMKAKAIIERGYDVS